MPRPSKEIFLVTPPRGDPVKFSKAEAADARAVAESLNNNDNGQGAPVLVQVGRMVRGEFRASQTVEVTANIIEDE